VTTDAATTLKPFRDRLEELDQQLARLLAQRFDICREVADTKRAAGIPMMQPERVEQVKQAYAARGRELGVDPAFMYALASLVIGEACRLEDDIIGAAPSPGEERSR